MVLCGCWHCTSSRREESDGQAGRQLATDLRPWAGPMAAQMGAAPRIGPVFVPWTYSFGRVIAPSEAEETSAAYLARTPVS